MKKKQLKQVRKLAMLLSATLLLEQPAIINSTLHVYAQGEMATTEVSKVETSEATDETIESVATEESVEATTETSTEVSNETSEAVLAESSDEASNSEASDATVTSSESSETDATDASNASSETDTTDASNESSETDATDASNESSETDATDATDTAAETSNEESQPLKEKATEQFTDIPEGEWYVDAVQFVYSQKIMNGVDNTLFGPSGTLTREQFITVIYNMENKPETAFQKIYEDVAEETLWYAKPVTWASINGITSGIGDGLFGTGKDITREQLATLLYNYAKEVDQFKLTIDEKLVANFPDADQISDWATTGMSWAITNGVMSGKAGQDGKNFLDPKGNATRAECAQMIKNLIEKALKGNDSEESEEDKDPLVGTEKIIDDKTIVNFDTSSAPKSVGRIFYKELVFEDEIARTTDGLNCVRDQLLVYAKDDVTYETVEADVLKDNARIVGCAELIGFYQIEFNNYLSPEELKAKYTLYESKDWVAQVGYNLVHEEQPTFHSNDLYGKTTEADIEEWDSSNPGGANWAIEEIDLAEALLHAKVIKSLSDPYTAATTDHLSRTKLGLIDSAFDLIHEDLNFTNVYENGNPRYPSSDTYLDNHGTSVAGIIGAEFNNGKGLTGVSVKSQLYGYSAYMDKQKYDEIYDKQLAISDNIYIDRRNSIAKLLIAVTLLISVDNVKAINYSMSYYDDMIFAMSYNGGVPEATKRRNQAKALMDQESATMAYALNKFLKKGYDFLIIAAAGNTNDDKFYRCSTDKRTSGYINVDEFTKMSLIDKASYVVKDYTTYGAPNSNATIKSGVDMQGKYASCFTYISENEPCYDHIICVGAMNKLSGVYKYSRFSNKGDRVDLYAPGDFIYTSTVIASGSPSDYYTPFFDGTSAATPFVTGSVGLAYSVEPNLKAVDLKKMVVETSRDRKNGTTVVKNVLNVGGLIEHIVNQKSSNQGMLHLTVKDQNGNPVPMADVKICHMDQVHTNGWGIIIWEASAPDNVLINAQTDYKGEVHVALPAKRSDYNGCYVVLADNCGISGNALSIGQMVWPRCIFYDGIEPLTEMERTITLVPYSKGSEKQNLQIQTYSTAQGEGMLTSYKVSFYTGWNLTSFATPDYEFNVNGEFLREDLPKGRYTVKIECPGYKDKYMEILVAENIKPYKICVDKQ